MSSMEFLNAIQHGVDDQKPSLFEILSEQQLSALIPPSLRYLLAIATHRNPRYLLRVLNSFEELYALISLLVGRYYLQVHGGGFVENFYGLKRERLLRIKGGEIPRAQLGTPQEVKETLKLRESDIWKNLAVIVGLPYLKRKLDDAYEVHAASANLLGPSFEDRNAYPTEGTIRQKTFWWYKLFLRRVYPSVNAAYYFTSLAFSMAYLFDSSKYHSPWLWLIGTRLRRLTAADHDAAEQLLQPPKPTSQSGGRPGLGNSMFRPQIMMRTIVPGVLSSLRLLLPASVFALQFLEWWHNSDFSRQLSKRATLGLELAPPTVTGRKEMLKDADAKSPADRRDSGLGGPPISSTSQLPIFVVPGPQHTTEDSDNNSALCPICESEIQTPTVAQTGFVYCYTCIHKWLDGTHDRQERFMAGGATDEKVTQGWMEDSNGSRVNKWESGAGRDPVTGRRVLGGTSGLRRVMV